MRQRLQLAAFVLIAALSVDLRPLWTALRGAPAPDAVLADRMARPWIGYDEFLEGVRRHTQPGHSVAIVLPSRSWNSGYEYGYRRAVYLLAGRTTLPVLAADDALLQASLDRATHVAVWGDGLDDPRRRLLWSGSGGRLLGSAR